jgi:hypothetical protein
VSATQDIHAALVWTAVGGFRTVIGLDPLPPSLELGPDGMPVAWCAGSGPPLAIEVPEDCRRSGGRLWAGEGDAARPLRARAALELAIRGEGGFTLAAPTETREPAPVAAGDDEDEWPF